MLKDLILKNRSYRRFYQDYKVDIETLKEFVNLARLSASSANLQPIRFILSCNSEKNKLIFPCLAWAGYLKNWNGPIEGERPSAYIIILGDKEIGKDFEYDSGIAAQSILLGAAEKGLGGCLMGAINREKLREELMIPEQYKILLAIALGKPKEKVIIEVVNKTGDIKYWRDEEDIHHVPKRDLDDIILKY